jgi:prepilin-type N-terminal cleavage/methylation domain-containing protein
MISEKRRTIQSEKGFTLLEMIVAVTLVVMMAVGIWSVFRTSLRAWSRGTEYIDASQRQRNILDMVRKQLASAYPLTAPPDPNSPNPVLPISSNLIFQGTETSLQFISLNSLHFQDSPGLTLVNYEVAQGPEGAAILVEREERFLGQIPDYESETDLAGMTPLFGNLTQCYFEYLSEDEEEPWVREWDAEERGQLPEAVAVNMAAVDTDGNTRSHQIIVPIHAKQAALTTNILGRGGTVPRAPGRGMGRDIEFNTDEDEFEGDPGRRPGYILRRRLERERRQ